MDQLVEGHVIEVTPVKRLKISAVLLRRLRDDIQSLT